MPDRTELHWTCDRCKKPIKAGEGALVARNLDIWSGTKWGRGEPCFIFEQVAVALHYKCDRFRAEGHHVDVLRLETWEAARQVLDEADRSEQLWFTTMEATRRIEQAALHARLRREEVAIT